MSNARRMSLATGRRDRGGLAGARRIARVLDDAYVDPILGFVAPGIGDLVTSGFGLYLVGVAIQRRLPVVVIARMLINLAVDATIGAIPILGDAFDVFYKANRRNLALLDARYQRHKASAGDWLFVAIAALAVLAALVIPIYLTIRLLGWLF